MKREKRKGNRGKGEDREVEVMKVERATHSNDDRNNGHDDVRDARDDRVQPVPDRRYD